MIIAIEREYNGKSEPARMCISIVVCFFVEPIANAIAAAVAPPLWVYGSPSITWSDSIVFDSTIELNTAGVTRTNR